MSCARAIFGGTSILDLTKWDGVSDRFDGWFMNGVTHTVSNGTYKGGAGFSGSEHWIKSPRFPGLVTNVTLTLCCSTTGTPTRILATYPLDGRGNPLEDGGNSQEELQFAVPAKTSKYENQAKDISKYGTDAFRIGMNSGKTGTWYVLRIVVDYDETQPIAHSVEDVDVITRCWKLSEFSKGGDGRRVRTADFSFLAEMKKQTVWTNGVSVDSFYSFDNGQASTNIYYARPGSYIHGLYALNTNEVGNAVSALSVLPTKDAGMEILLPVELDIGCRVAGVEVSFGGWQGKIGTNDTTLAFSWSTSDTLLTIGTGGWKERNEGNYSGGISNHSRSVVFQEGDVRNSRILGFRWRVPRQVEGSMLGIADVRVSAWLKPEGTLLLIR